MEFAFLSHAVFGHLRKMSSYRLETPTRKPDAARNIEGGSHVCADGRPCFFGHVQNFMRRDVFSALVWRQKFGKKLTNNFIILCELLHGAVQNFRHIELSPPALAAKAGF
ncbi:hypothetical protein [Rhizobium aegyptiacum]|uniref:hypothetical protein n=1 Tax=Rhizobium aegyptiacum TaxID=1764550 RepID=UPI0012E73324|nr:hypothetical protein [Rhizobium aegyptiacum]